MSKQAVQSKSSGLGLGLDSLAQEVDKEEEGHEQEQERGREAEKDVELLATKLPSPQSAGMDLAQQLDHLESTATQRFNELEHLLRSDHLSSKLVEPRNVKRMGTPPRRPTQARTPPRVNV